MMKKLSVSLLMILLALLFFPLAANLQERSSVGTLAQAYLRDGAEQLNAPNLVTSVIVTYRGLDTLGEVTVLFAAAAGIALVFSGKGREHDGPAATKRESSELVKTGAGLLLPLITTFGIYIFAHGHLTPGGGFQGGVIIASGVFFVLAAGLKDQLSHGMLTVLEMLAGAGYVAVGLLGIWLALGFLDPRFLPAGEFGSLFSAGAIPVIYSLVGIKVGAELSGVIDTLKRSRP